ncbi:hypothetical protein PWG71_08655 [Nocardiopsis sp. N85]|uniref:hypothetical protein n=1 Tax=Nocardiopsis sp. N85 TaxID=3029400 RepID=UPI00237F17EB|nr:hypothetical protein [Nocardiopsis sp. N85]MDE3721458.1 hypothetical protein [Nocardiopsis sp. N85]
MGNTPDHTRASHHHGGRPPLAVWACAPRPGDRALHTHQQSSSGHGGEAVIPGRLAERLVAEYSGPGQRVVDLTGNGRVAEQARLQDRRHQIVSRALDAVGATAATDCDLAWADLTVTALTGATSRTASVGALRRRIRARVEFAALITCPGGIVAVITPVGRTSAGVVDPAPGVVRAASCAGLVYLQHVIAVTVPICEAGLGAAIPVRGADGFDPDPGPALGEGGAGLSTSVAEAAATITSPAHLNISVFRKKGRTVPAQACEEVQA